LLFLIAFLRLCAVFSVVATRKSLLVILQSFFAKKYLFEIARIVVLATASVLYYFQLISVPVLLTGVAFGLYALVRTAVVDLFTKRKIGTEIFIAIAVVISVIGKEYLAGSIMLMIILIAEFIATANTERARASIKALIGSVPKTAILKRDDKEVEVPIISLKVGDVVLARTGDKIPVDGTVVGGDGSVNQAPITGESMPQEKVVGNEVFAGTIVESGAIDIQVTKFAEDTLFARIISLVEEAQAQEAPIEKFTDKIATYLIPVALVFVTGVYLYTHDVRLIIALLIFMSPAELGLATPLVTISGIARAAREGILMKGGMFLENLSKVDTFVFDKTGTLTVGTPEVSRVDVIDTNYSEQEIVRLAAALERRSSHPLAKAILQYAEALRVSIPEPTDFNVVQGRGVYAHVEGKKVVLGNLAFLQEQNIQIPSGSTPATHLTGVYLAVDQHFVGALYLSDTIKPGAKETIERLLKSGVKRIIMLTGDSEGSAKSVADELGIVEYKAHLLPEGKLRYIQQLQNKGAMVAMVGDGVNDAPVLVQANVGIAMGAMGTQAAMEAADIVLTDDNLLKIAKARTLSKRAFRTIKENVFFGVGVVHVAGIILVLLKVLGPIEAAAIHLVPDVLVFLNSTKLLKVKLE